MEINELYNLIIEAFEMPISYFTSSKKRIYYLYLISSTLIAYYIYSKSKSKSTFIKYLLPKNIWLSKSAFVDYLMIFFNSFIKLTVIIPYLFFGLYIAFYTNEYLLKFFGYPSFSLTQTQTIVFYTITLTLVGDLASYLIHLLMHKIPFLWEFHKVHHSATKLTPITQYRIHPIELIINNLKGILIFGVLTGVFDYLSDNQVHKIIFLGVNIFGFIFMLFGANLRHSHIEFKYPSFLEKIFISPFQHQIHHSNNPKHYDKNLGSKFAIWDLMFGTLILSKTTKNLKFGLGNEDNNYNTFLKNLLTPFVNFFKLIKKNFIKKPL
ncbi:sterol desaturase family protein [Tenacibaculum ovolyticum]|uniref:sterol desaturase family protein n=1 Tax=Tenacibaculum ovolyticum TaxID=104270 RepID=UPI0009ED8089|nr:sterol desaturase family protein [Tenacibaculum ovolyticum]